MSLEENDATITNLKEAWAKIEAGDKAAVLKESTKTQGNPQTQTSKKFSVADNHSKPVTQVDRNPGSVDGAREVGDSHGSDKAVELAKPIQRSEGAKAGNSEVGDEHGKKAAVEGSNPVPRSEGSSSAPQKYDAFRAKIKQTLGLSLEDPINKVGDGLNGKDIAGKTKTK
jgi:hypothetical protein